MHYFPLATAEPCRVTPLEITALSGDYPRLSRSERILADSRAGSLRASLMSHSSLLQRDRPTDRTKTARSSRLFQRASEQTRS